MFNHFTNISIWFNGVLVSLINIQQSVNAQITTKMLIQRHLIFFYLGDLGD